MWIAVGIGIVVLLVVILIYNGLIAKKNQVANVFGAIDALLKKRYDLIPQLVATVKAYMQHERSLLTEITEARAKAVSGRLSDDQQVELDNIVSKTLGSIMVAVEMFPTNIVASMMGYKTKSFFEIAAEQRENVDADKLLKS